MAKKQTRGTSSGSILFNTELEMSKSPEASIENQKEENFFFGLGRGERIAAIGVCLLLVVGALGATGFGERIGSVFSSENSSQKTTQSSGATQNSSMPASLNPFAFDPTPTPLPLSKEYIYAGSRMLAVEDATPQPSPTPTPTPAPGYEGDVNPRPNQAGNPNPGQSGDGVATGGDVTQIRRFALGLDTPDSTNTNEFQKADCAPLRDPSGNFVYGDGIVSSGDVTQVRRYSLGLDPPTAAAGPTGSGPGNAPTMARATRTDSAQNTESASNTRTVKPVSISRTGNTLTVGIELNTEAGDRGANSLSFTLDFDSSILSNPTNCRTGDATRTGGTAAEVWCGNTKTTPGHLGVLIELEPDQTFGFGAQQVALINFTIAEGATASPIFGLSDMPSLRFVSDVMGEPLPATFIADAISGQTQQKSFGDSEKRKGRIKKLRQ